MSHDPYGTNPRRYDADAIGWGWGWIAGICALLLIVGLIVWGGSNGNNNTASNSPGQIAPQASTTGAAPSAPAPSGRAATPQRSTTGSGQ
jgi:hypothetical protein